MDADPFSKVCFYGMGMFMCILVVVHSHIDTTMTAEGHSVSVPSIIFKQIMYIWHDMVLLPTSQQA